MPEEKKKAFVSLISELIKLIEAKLKEQIDLNYLSRESGFSKYHLHHLFRSLAGMSLMSYVRGRKLSESLNELAGTDLNIIDIAAEYGYDFEQSYIRSFRKQFGITPAQYRSEQPELAIVQKIDVSRLWENDEAVLFEPFMVSRPSFFLQGLNGDINHSQKLQDCTKNPLVTEFEKKYLYSIKNAVNTAVYYGLVRYTDEDWLHNYYMASTETSVLNKSEPPLESVEIPRNEYAVFKYIGLHSAYGITYKLLLELYHYIMSVWRWHSTLSGDFPYHFERIDMARCGENYCEMDIYMPVRKA